MSRYVIFAGLIMLASACSKEQGGVAGQEPKEMLDDVQQQLDQAAATAEQRLEEGLKKID